MQADALSFLKHAALVYQGFQKQIVLKAFFVARNQLSKLALCTTGMCPIGRQTAARPWQTIDRCNYFV
ncbi:MAG: hypothetical protein ACN6NT_11660 [Comamonas sp.]